MAYLAGFDIGGTKCAVVLGKEDPTHEFGVVILEKQVIATADYPDPYAAIDTLCSLLDGMLSAHGVLPGDLPGIGVSCGSPLDSKTGVIINPPNLPGWINIPICGILKSRYGCPARLENDANACAVAEWRFGAARGTQNAIFLTFGTGLGAGLILDGRLYSGTNGNAGETGHIRLADHGPVGYGKQGSFEGFCSGGGIAQLARTMVLEELQVGNRPALCPTHEELPTLTAKKVAEFAHKGDPLARAIYAESGRYLGKGLSLLVDLFNPEVIVIGSIFARSRDLLWDEARAVMERECLPGALAVCRVEAAKLGENLGDYAALALAL